MPSEFLSSLLRFGLPEGQPVLVAVSGGVDSMVLASLMFDSGREFAVAHCNFQLRGEASDEDEIAVRLWCNERTIKFHSTKIETKTLANCSDRSIQMVARDERYAFFEDLMDRYGYAATLLAHHADDRVESLLINLLRGTGFRGLQGMPSQRDRYLRPLIGYTKAKIREYAVQHRIPFREDASNSETHYQRNWVRLRLLPMLIKADPEAFQKLKLFAERVENELANYERWIEGRLAELGTESNLSIQKIQESNAPFSILKEALKTKGFSSDQVFEVLEVLNSSSGAEVCSQTHRVVKDRDLLLITELDRAELVPVFQYELTDRMSLSTLSTPSNVALMDAAKVDVSKLELRKWKEGDRFKPLGMKGWKKLSNFFIDEKLSILEKENTWLLTYLNEVVWVVGMRLDDRYKVDPDTQKVLKITAFF
jgi:tRNA(Ile)-lysidine synthase